MRLIYRPHLCPLKNCSLKAYSLRVCSLKAKAGFTLIDSLIVIAILAMTMGFGWPSLQSTLDESRTDMYMKTLSRDIMYMRVYAITQGTPVTLCPLKGGKCIKDWKEKISVFIDYNMDRKMGGKDRLLKLLDDPRKGDYFSYPRIGLTFRSDGSINGFQSGTFRYCPVDKNSLMSKGLVVNQAGRPRYRQKKVKCK
jgi:type IV fimbrial biogenesis protein FimT